MLKITARMESRWLVSVRLGRLVLRCARWFALLTLAWCGTTCFCHADDIAAEADPSQPVSVAADWCCHWKQGTYDVWHLRGNCYVNQGLTYARGPEAILWIDSSQSPQQPTKVIAYMEAPEGERVAVDYQNHLAAGETQTLGRQTASTWFERLHTKSGLRMKVPRPAEEPERRPVIYERGLAQFDPQRRRRLLLAQYTEFAPAPLETTSLPPGMRRIQLFPRNSSLPEIQWKGQPAGGRVAIVSGGIRVLVEGLPAGDVPAALGPLGTVDITTDRAVIWTADDMHQLSSESFQAQDAPLEIYMEGNIEFRQGDRVVYADRMFYDVRRQIGVILNAELLTPLPKYEDKQYQGLVRLKAGAIRQLDESHFAATDAVLTTSRMEEPTYHFAADEMSFQDIQRQDFDSAHRPGRS